MSNRALLTGVYCIAAGVVGLLGGAGCATTGEASEATPRTVEEAVLQGVTSACDEHGNRVYRRANPTSVALAVVGQDPTCRPRGAR